MLRHGALILALVCVGAWAACLSWTDATWDQIEDGVIECFGNKLKGNIDAQNYCRFLALGQAKNNNDTTREQYIKENVDCLMEKKFPQAEISAAENCLSDLICKNS